MDTLDRDSQRRSTSSWCCARLLINSDATRPLRVNSKSADPARRRACEIPGPNQLLSPMPLFQLLNHAGTDSLTHTQRHVCYSLNAFILCARCSESPARYCGHQAQGEPGPSTGAQRGILRQITAYLQQLSAVADPGPRPRRIHPVPKTNRQNLYSVTLFGE